MKFIMFTIAVAISIAPILGKGCNLPIPDTDFSGDDLMALPGVTSTNCWVICSVKRDCLAYTFADSVCYLKYGKGVRQWKQGAVSGECDGPMMPYSPPPTEQPDPCSNDPFGYCGNIYGATCCPIGQFCEPRSSMFYQCTQLPAKCSRQFTNVDFAGNDLKAVYGLHHGACCEECAKTPECKAFTYVFGLSGAPACYLKSGEGEHRELAGAVSGVLN